MFRIFIVVITIIMIIYLLILLLANNNNDNNNNDHNNNYNISRTINQWLAALFFPFFSFAQLNLMHVFRNVLPVKE